MMPSDAKPNFKYRLPSVRAHTALQTVHRHVHILFVMAANAILVLLIHLLIIFL